MDKNIIKPKVIIEKDEKFICDELIDIFDFWTRYDKRNIDIYEKPYITVLNKVPIVKDGMINIINYNSIICSEEIKNCFYIPKMISPYIFSDNVNIMKKENILLIYGGEEFKLKECNTEVGLKFTIKNNDNIFKTSVIVEIIIGIEKIEDKFELLFPQLSAEEIINSKGV